jgi:acetyl-CoA synthetase
MSETSEQVIYEPSAETVAHATIGNMAKYHALCKEAEQDYEGFWGKLANELLTWQQPFTQVLDETSAPFYKWFTDGRLNVSYNCLDRHLENKGDKVALLFEADDGSSTTTTYRELYHQVCRFANGLKSLDLNIGDRVIIYMPMGIEAIVAMQACARLGLIHSVVFGGFSAKSLVERIHDAGARAVITSDGQFRGGKTMPLKSAVDEALQDPECSCVQSVVVFKRTGMGTSWNAARDIWWHDLIADKPDTCDPVWVDAEHPLFLLYTSGSTGKPKGVQHASAGYLLHAQNTMRWTFDIKDNDVF